MEDDKWSFCFSSASARNHRSTPTPKYPSGSCIALEDMEGGDEMAVDYPCPFCEEDYDLVELCQHIDEEHSLEADHGICPLCARWVKMNMVDHIIAQHKNILKSEQRHRFYRDESYQRKNKYLQSLLEDSPPTSNAAKSVPDSLISFIYNPPLPDEPKLVQPDSSTEANPESKSLDKDSSKKDRKWSSPLSDTDQMERTKRCEFVQGLLSSTMFVDDEF
ncbi:PREDICTED: protein DEHYDRATION-INDUCED 19 homolog 5 [Tarenaya hassleriana]|uniref:protein DEHYDRATION-INDUCED 19 homolog 5 n=1 Tax=Tarenaya hassleriana TaxID=28532 RepID=UPI00053C3576|nr:PREDICTED: protein DEHYDRATION-INDUCED 19 homolog 5 [Tarenaya hassleriana]